MKTIRECDIVFVRNDNFFARLIQWSKKSDINHVGIITEIHVDGVTVLEAHGSGVREHFYHENYIQSNCEVRRPFIRLSDDKRDEVIREAKEYLTFRYDWFGIKRFAIKVITFGYVTLTRDTSEAVTCGELVTRVLQTFSYKPLKNIHPEHADPETVRRSIPLIIKELTQ